MADIDITPYATIPYAELRFAFSRSPGPGGQNVNKLATKVTLSFDLTATNSLNDHQKETIRRKLGTRITQDDILQITCSTERSQKSNREEAVSRFARLLREALKPKKPRRKTKPTAASRERRLTEKARRGQTKSMRRGRFKADD